MVEFAMTETVWGKQLGFCSFLYPRILKFNTQDNIP
jgi:hypothetical protein